jgi:hypothetical protein
MTKIYESPDKGKTVYEREFGEEKRTLTNFMYGEEIGYSFTANAHFQSCPPAFSIMAVAFQSAFQSCPPAFSIMTVAQQEDYLKTKTPEEQQKIYASTSTLNPLTGPIYMFGKLEDE